MFMALNRAWRRAAASLAVSVLSAWPLSLAWSAGQAPQAVSQPAPRSVNQAPPRAAPPTVTAQSVPAASGQEARVIVAYRSDAPLARAHPLALEAGRVAVRQAHERRAAALGQRAGLTLKVGRAVGPRAHVVTARGLNSQALARRLSEDPNVAYAEVDQRRLALYVPNDPLFTAGSASRGPVAGQWHLRAPTEQLKSATNVQGAWLRTTGSPEVVVAVLDTGAWYEHEDLQGRLLPGYDMVLSATYSNDGDGRDPNAADPGDWVPQSEATEDCPASSSSWHGTRVASIVGAATGNGLGMAGVAPGARVMPVRVLAKCGGYDSDIAAGMRWAAGIAQPGLPGSTTPARVINLSLGGSGSCSNTYRDAVNDVTAKGAVVVVAAGNSAGRSVGAPANCPGVITVAGLRHAGTKVGFSDLGPEIAIAAPAGNCVNVSAGSACLYPIQTAYNSGSRAPEAGGSRYSDGLAYSVGTSFAAPIVAGTVALMLSARPALKPGEVKSILQKTARVFPAAGADNGPDDPTPVATCQAPSGVDQLQCYCTTALCGAGMLDAAAAVEGAFGSPMPRIEVGTATPTAGVAVSLSAAGSVTGAGRSVSTYYWEIVNGGGIVTGFSGATNAVTASFTPAAAGSVVVRLTMADNWGVSASVETTVTVAATPAPPAPAPTPTPNPTPTPSEPAGSGGGGGASGTGWVLGLLVAAWALRPRRPDPPA